MADQPTPCPVCDQTGRHRQLTCTDYLVSQRTFDIAACACGLWLTHPAPAANELGTYYPATNYISHQKNSGSLFETVYFAARRWMMNRKMAMIARYQKPGRLLDFGCGTGAFVAAATQHGWDASGYEPSAHARANAPSSLRIWASESHIAGPFQVITLWHVLEHLPDLRESLDRLAAHLAPTGLLVVAVPNRLSWDAAHYQSHWAAYDVPRHLWHFTPATMEQLLRRAGLQLVAQQPLCLDAWYVSLLSEKYRGTHAALAWVKALLLGGYSNLRAQLGNRQFSSLVYFARKP